MTEILDKKIKILQYIEYLSLQLLAHKNNKVDKEQGVYCDTMEGAIEAVNDMLPDDITETLYEIYQTQVCEATPEEVENFDEDFLEECKDKVIEKINIL